MTEFNNTMKKLRDCYGEVQDAEDDVAGYNILNDYVQLVLTAFAEQNKQRELVLLGSMEDILTALQDNVEEEYGQLFDPPGQIPVEDVVRLDKTPEEVHEIMSMLDDLGGLVLARKEVLTPAPHPF